MQVIPALHMHMHTAPCRLTANILAVSKLFVDSWRVAYAKCFGLCYNESFRCRHRPSNGSLTTLDIELGRVT